MYHNQVGFIPWSQGWFNTHKKINVIHINKTNKQTKNYMIIIIDAGKEFDKIQHPVKIKILAKWVQRDESWHNKCYLWQIHSQCNTQWQKTEIPPTKIWNKTGCQLSTLFFNIVLEVLATAIKEEKEIRVIQIGREEVKLSLYAHGMTLYIQKPEDFTQKLLELIDVFSKVAG